MGFFSRKKHNKSASNSNGHVSKTLNKVFELSQELKNILVSHNCIDFDTVSSNGLDYALFMYDMDVYRQVMSLKYSSFQIETIIRLIFITFENSNKRVGSEVEDNMLFNTFKKLSNSLREICSIANQQGIDEFVAIAMYFCSDECQMNEFDIEDNEDLILEIAEHFKKIINLPLCEI